MPKTEEPRTNNCKYSCCSHSLYFQRRCTNIGSDFEKHGHQCGRLLSELPWEERHNASHHVASASKTGNEGVPTETAVQETWQRWGTGWKWRVSLLGRCPLDWKCTKSRLSDIKFSPKMSVFRHNKHHKTYIFRHRVTKFCIHLLYICIGRVF